MLGRLDCISTSLNRRFGHCDSTSKNIASNEQAKMEPDPASLAVPILFVPDDDNGDHDDDDQSMLSSCVHV